MIRKKLKSTELNFPPIIFGGNVFGWTLNEKESFDLLDKLLEKNFSFIDTADSYSHWAPGNSGGESEAILGKWMKERGVREHITIATKVGSNPGREGRNVSKKYILEAVENSLRRLRTDFIDLYFTHWDNESTPVEETLEAYMELLQQGKIRNIGASNLSPTRLLKSLKAAKENNLPKYEVLQPEYNLVEKNNYEENYRPIAQEYNLAVMPYFSLASGFLTGKYRKEGDLVGARKSMVKRYFNEKSLHVLKQMDTIAQDHQVSHAAVALAWLMQQPTITAPIVSATKESHIKAFQEAINLKLSIEEMEQLSLK